MTDETWPQPPTDERPWHERVLYLYAEGRNTHVRVREVQLWGKTVLIDEQHDVYCNGCRRFVKVEILGRINNSHGVGLPNRVGGRLIPMDSDSDSGQRAEEGF